MNITEDSSYKAATLSEVMSLEDMEDSMEAGFLADLPQDGGALAALERLDTPPPTPIFLSELESSPLSSAGLGSPLADSEQLEPCGADQDTMTMDDLLNSCGVSCDASVDSPLLSSLDLMWGASAAPAAAAAPLPAPAATPAPPPRPASGSAAAAATAASATQRSSPPTSEQQLQAEVQRAHRRQQQDTQQLLQRQVQQLQKQQILQQRQDQQQQQQLIKQLKQAQRQQLRQKQHLHWQQHQLQQHQSQQQRSHQLRQQHEDSSARSPGSSSAGSAAGHRGGPAKVRRKTRVITIPSAAGATTVTLPHIVICSPSVINSRPALTSALPVTFSVQDRQTAAARVSTGRPPLTFSGRQQSRPLGGGGGVGGAGVRRRVVGRAAAGALAKRHSVESAPSSPETAPCSLLRIPCRQKPVLKVTTATQTGEAVDEVLRNNDSTLIRLLVTGQDLNNGYKLCPNGQCLTPERQPAPPSLFAGLPDRGSSVLLSMLSHDDEPQLPALFPSETAGRLLDDPL